MTNDENIECSSLLMEENGNNIDSYGNKSFRIIWKDLSICSPDGASSANYSSRNYSNFFTRLINPRRNNHQILNAQTQDDQCLDAINHQVLNAQTHDDQCLDAVEFDDRSDGEHFDCILPKQCGRLNSGTMNCIIGGSTSARHALIQSITGRQVTGSLHGRSSRQLSVNGQVALVSPDSRESLLKVSIVTDAIFSDTNISPDAQNLFHSHSTAKQILEEALLFEEKSRLSKISLEGVANGLKLSPFLNKRLYDCPSQVIKALSIGVELVTCPDILVIDQVSVSDIETLRLVSNFFKSNDCHSMNKHMMIIASIPSISYRDANELFDSVYILNPRGRLIIQEEVSKLPLVVKENEIYLDNFSDLISSVSTLKKSLLSNSQCANSKKTNSGDANHGDANNRDYVTAPMNVAVKNVPSKGGVTNFINLMRRQISRIKSDPLSIFFPTLLSVAMIIFLSIISIGRERRQSSDGCFNSVINLDKFFGANQSFIHFFTQSTPASIFNNSMEEMNDIIDKIKYFLIIINFSMMIHSLIGCIKIRRQIGSISREVKNLWYNSASAHLAESIIKTVIIAFQVILISTLILIFTRQNMTTRQFLVFSTSLFFLIYISDTIGTLFGCLIQNNTNAILVTISYTGIMMLFSGYFVSDEMLPKIFTAIPLVSHARHSFELIILSLFGLGRCTSRGSLLKHEVDLNEVMESRPIELLSKAIKALNLKASISKVVSPYLGMKDDICLASVINSTRSYLGIEEDGADDSDAENVKDVVDSASDLLDGDADDFDEQIDEYEKFVDTSSDSLPLLIFGFDNHHLNKCLISLCLLLILYKILVMIAFRKAVN